MSNRWQDDDNAALADNLRHAADYLADEELRSDSDPTVEALREAAERLGDADALLRGRITTWHAQRVTAGQLRAYLEAAEWAAKWEATAPGEEWYCAEPMPGVEDVDLGYEFERSSARYGDISFLLADDGHGYETLRYHYEAIESIAAIEDRGELAVWTDLQQIDEEAA